MADTLRRRVAELRTDWFVVRSTRHLFGQEWDVICGGRALGSVIADTEVEARAAAVDMLPPVDTDPVAALALLAGMRYTHHHAPGGIQMPECYEFTDRVVIQVEGAHYAANANTFAEAACAAWLAWKEAVDE